VYDLRRSLVAPQGAAVHESARSTDNPALQELVMTFTAAHISPLVALVAGILILIMPRLLNYIVALYLILVGIMGLNAIHHFIR
jgi:hypothetical protein